MSGLHDRPTLRSLGSGDDVEDEMRHHVLECAELLEQQGWSHLDALQEAERRFGDVDRVRRELRGRRAGVIDLVRSIGADLRYALRGIRNKPGFTLAVTATLALGIGAASSIFAVVDALLLRPMPYRDADRLVEVNHAAWQAGGYTPGNTSSRIDAWREAAGGLFDGWVAWSHGRIARVDEGSAEELELVAVTAGADTLLGIPLLAGRAFSAEDVRPGGTDVVILGRGFYERLGADPSIVGSTLRLETGPVTIVGVLRGGVLFPAWGGDPDLWIPIRDDFTAAGRPLRNVTGFWARLRPGVDIEAAQQRADVLAAALQEREPLDGGWNVLLSPVGAYRIGADLKRAVLTLSATVGAIFLIAWINGINLLLVRSSARTRELAVRMAIGGSRRRLLRQLLIEGMVLGAIGGIAALALAVAGLHAIRGIIPWVIAWSSPHALDVGARTLVFTFATSLIVGIMLGLVPALHVLRTGGLSPLARRPSDDVPERRRLRNGLVMSQIALSMTLLAAAGLLVKSFAQLMNVDPGYNHENVALAYIGLSPTRYPEAAQRAEFFRRLEEVLEAHPGVQGVTRSDSRGFRSNVDLEAEGMLPPRNQPYRIPSATIAPDYLDVMGVQLVAGRGFTAADANTDAVIIDRDLARFLWSGDAIGKRFRLGDDGEWLNVVGVVRDLRLMGRDQREGPYQILYPSAPASAGGWVQVGVRTTGDPALMLNVIRDAVAVLDPRQTIYQLRTAADALAEDAAEPRFLVTLMGLLAFIAVALAAIGLYGVLSYSVARRDRELAIRMAIGADVRRLRAMVLGEGIIVAIGGVILGILGTLAISRMIEQLLYDVPPHDAATLATTTSLLLAVAAFASLLPARRATRVNPSEILRRD